jgi:hypothetical protein
VNLPIKHNRYGVQGIRDLSNHRSVSDVFNTRDLSGQLDRQPAAAGINHAGWCLRLEGSRNQADSLPYFLR